MIFITLTGICSSSPLWLFLSRKNLNFSSFRLLIHQISKLAYLLFQIYQGIHQQFLFILLNRLLSRCSGRPTIFLNSTPILRHLTPWKQTIIYQFPQISQSCRAQHDMLATINFLLLSTPSSP